MLCSFENVTFWPTQACTTPHRHAAGASCGGGCAVRGRPGPGVWLKLLVNNASPLSWCLVVHEIGEMLLRNAAGSS